MSNNIEKAQALRALADIFESGKLPDATYDDQPLRIVEIYPDARARDLAVKVFSDAGYPLINFGGPATGDLSAQIGADDDYYPGVQFAMAAGDKIGDSDV